MPRWPILALACLTIGCSRAEAPVADGVCWRLHDAAGARPSFTRVAAGVHSLETCAVLLEGLRLQGQGDTDGAYQGYFIFVDAAGMGSAHHLNGIRYPLFQPPQRATIDRDLTRLIRENGGQLPQADTLLIDRG
ncbi:MAG TPA: hypothetical protein VGL58_04070 [Caulobacteraceae bacterium]|jgi:hypothetical protein